MKKGSVIVESLTVFIVILCCIFVALPFFVSTNKKEKNIVKWSQKFSNIEYAYSVLKAQSPDDDFMSSAFQNRLKIFLRAKKDVPSFYKQEFLNRQNKNDIYVFNKFFENEKGIIIGYKWINPKCRENQLYAVMSIDINGIENPNMWGVDVFGVNVYRDNVEPAGKRYSLSEIRKDCSKRGTGVFCSEYYLRGGLVGRE